MLFVTTLYTKTAAADRSSIYGIASKMGGEGHVVKEAHEHNPLCDTGALVSRGRTPGAPRAKLAKALSPAGADVPEGQGGICCRPSGALILKEKPTEQPESSTS